MNVKLGYYYLISNPMYLLLVPLLGISSAHLSTLGATDLVQLSDQLRKVYLVDFACYKPDPAQICTRGTFMERSELTAAFTEENLTFQRRILERSGLGQRTHMPEAMLQVPPNQRMEEARADAEAVTFGAVDQLLAKTGVKAMDIGILVVNCSLFNPTPSLSAMVVNHYKLRGNVLSYNLGGMGCGAGLISIDLAKQLLRVQPNTYALVVSIESILNWYFGNDRSMLVTNCLFWMGGVAIFLSNRRSSKAFTRCCAGAPAAPVLEALLPASKLQIFAVSCWSSVGQFLHYWRHFLVNVKHGGLWHQYIGTSCLQVPKNQKTSVDIIRFRQTRGSNPKKKIHKAS